MANGKVVFFGTSDICCPFLEVLKDHFDLHLIITQPDAKGGRNRKKIITPPVKTFAQEKEIQFLQPEKLKESTLIEKLKSIDSAIGVVISYAKFIPRVIYNIPKYKVINVHFSLLPFYRGAAPVQRAIENGDTTTGITIFEIEKRMDAGPIYAKMQVNIASDDTTEILWHKLSVAGASFLRETLEKIISGKIEKIPQDEDQATFAPPVKKEEGKINWHLTAPQIYNKFRAFTPWPGLFCSAKETQFKLKTIKVSAITHNQHPGDILARHANSFKICCGGGTVLEVLEFQPQGKKAMSPYSFCCGNPLPDRFECSDNP